MARPTGPQDKISKKYGIDIFGRGKVPEKITISHSVRRKRNPSEYGLQLMEKQKAKAIYGVLEKQFKNYVVKALKSENNSIEVLSSELEKRLDNVIYRLGFAPTRRMARQLVSHGHVIVNGKRLNIPSYQTKSGDVINLSIKATNIPTVNEIKVEDLIIPPWLLRKSFVGKVTREPKTEDFIEPISPRDILEFYSR